MPSQKGIAKNLSPNGSAPTAEPKQVPAYFLSLSLENVRCFGPKQTLDLSDGNGKPARWTVILGLNGTGKTTVLQALAGLEAVPFPSANVGYLPRLANPRKQSDLLFMRFKRSTTETSSDIVATFAVMDQLLSNSAQTVTRTLKIDPSETPSAEFGDHGDKQKPAGQPWCCAYGATRRIGMAYRTGTGWSDDPTESLFSDDAELRNPEDWLLELDYAAKSNKHNKDAQRRFHLAKELLLSLMPEGEIADIRCVPGSGPNPKARAEFQTPYGWVPLRQLGYGYQTLITWVADLANRMAERYPDSKNPLAEPAVVLVDEIDLHLHPKWQRKLMGFLTERFPNTQFIATAHSPLVAQAAAEANLAVLRREGDHVVIDNEVDNIRNWRIDQILTSDLFGLETARPPQIEALLLERKELLSKPKLTTADKRRLEELDAKIGPLPTGESAQEAKEREAIRKTLELLRNVKTTQTAGGARRDGENGVTSDTAGPPRSSVSGRPSAKHPIARPVISLPAANASEPGDTDLDVTITTNVVNIRYQLEVTDITGDPPFPDPVVIDIPAQPTRVIVATIPAADLPADHTFQIRVLVNPADAISGDQNDSINITTDA